MMNVAAIRMHQFGVQFYQAALTANDIDKLVRFEVLRYGDQGHQPVRGGRRGSVELTPISKAALMADKRLSELKVAPPAQLPLD